MNRTRESEQVSQLLALPRECSVLMERGKAAYRAGRKAEARFFFRAVLKMVPDYPDALLWLAFLAGGGRPSLVYLVRVLETDPTNQQARGAIRWARVRVGSQTGVTIPLPPVRLSSWKRYVRGMLLVLVVLVVGLITGLATAAFVLDRPLATPTRAHLIAVLSGGTPVPAGSPITASTVAAVPTMLDSRAASLAPLPSSTPTLTPTTARLELAASATITTNVAISPVPSSVLSVDPATEASYSSPRVANLVTESLPSSFSTIVTMTQASLTDAAVSPTPFPTAHIGDSFRWIDVDLSRQRLIAYEGETPVRTVIVSTGLPRTPTVTGRFKIYVKYRVADMSGPGYHLSRVPYVMYFYRGYALHGTYWHNSFGQPMSHGCVNLPTLEAEWLFNWASVGTLVVIHY